MEKDKSENKKEPWAEPRIYVIDFKETKGGDISSAAEQTRGTISTTPG